MAAKAAAAAAGAAGVAAALRGQPPLPRDLGQKESAGEPQADEDPEWSYERRSEELRARDDALRAAAAAGGAPDASRECAVLIVGGCAGGLSTAACLRHVGVEDVVVVERNRRPGDMWRSRYHRLHLHDIIQECHLPHHPMPDSFPTYPARQLFAGYLDDYCAQQGVRCLTQHSVTAVAPGEGGAGWRVQVVDHSRPDRPARIQYHAKHIVIANGVYNEPSVPAFPGLDTFRGQVIHSSRYTNGTDLGLKGKRVLVVGFGNSGAEILIDLCEHGAAPTALVRSPAPIVPRRTIELMEGALYRYRYLSWVPFAWLLAFAAPGIVVGFDLWAKLVTRLRWGGSLEESGLRVTWLGPITNMIKTFSPPVMDVGTVDLVRTGRVRVVPNGIARFTPGGAVFEGGATEEFDAVVLATGFQMIEGHRSFLDAASCEKLGSGIRSAIFGKIPPGRESAVPGIWFIYGRLQQIRDTAPGLAERIATRLGRSPKKDRAGLLLRLLLHVAVIAAWRVVRRRPRL